MNDLYTIFLNNKDNKILKWDHYFMVYDRYFSPFRGKPINLLEIGIFDGGSLRMWREYFGPQANIYGIDILPECKSLENEGFHISIGSQTDRNFLRRYKAEHPAFDIIIDDGGHTMKQQVITFQELYDAVKIGGIYLCEDVHTSYWVNYGGGLRRPGTFIEYSKKMVDQLNAWHSKQHRFQPDNITKTTSSIHFYDSMVLFEKDNREPPAKVESGTYKLMPRASMNKLSLSKRIKGRILIIFNIVLRMMNLPGWWISKP
ncbi:MAG: class I SAM-dependent methyltransferase [Saprospiraceae bacterium]|nr:class I SAM-dependent methyltransferase [Saprospiraceae bacterium]